MLEGKIYSSSCSWKRADGRAANSLKNFFFVPFYFFVWFSSYLSPGLNFTFFLVANWSWYSSRRPTIYQFYQNLVKVLIYRTSSRKIPGSLFTSSMRSLAKSLENWLLKAMNVCPTVIRSFHLILSAPSIWSVSSMTARTFSTWWSTEWPWSWANLSIWRCVPKTRTRQDPTSVSPSPIADRRHHYSAVCPV